jgi:hypothetical protein
VPLPRACKEAREEGEADKQDEVDDEVDDDDGEGEGDGEQPRWRFRDGLDEPRATSCAC